MGKETLTRREFLKLAGAAAGVALLPECFSPLTEQSLLTPTRTNRISVPHRTTTGTSTPEKQPTPESEEEKLPVGIELEEDRWGKIRVNISGFFQDSYVDNAGNVVLEIETYTSGEESLILKLLLGQNNNEAFNRSISLAKVTQGDINNIQGLRSEQVNPGIIPELNILKGNLIKISFEAEGTDAYTCEVYPETPTEMVEACQKAIETHNELYGKYKQTMTDLVNAVESNKPIPPFLVIAPFSPRIVY